MILETVIDKEYLDLLMACGYQIVCKQKTDSGYTVRIELDDDIRSIISPATLSFIARDNKDKKTINRMQKSSDKNIVRAANSVKSQWCQPKFYLRNRLQVCKSFLNNPSDDEWYSLVDSVLKSHIGQANASIWSAISKKLFDSLEHSRRLLRDIAFELPGSIIKEVTEIPEDDLKKCLEKHQPESLEHEMIKIRLAGHNVDIPYYWKQSIQMSTLSIDQIQTLSFNDGRLWVLKQMFRLLARFAEEGNAFELIYDPSFF